MMFFKFNFDILSSPSWIILLYLAVLLNIMFNRFDCYAAVVEQIIVCMTFEIRVFHNSRVNLGHLVTNKGLEIEASQIEKVSIWPITCNLYEVL